MARTTLSKSQQLLDDLHTHGVNLSTREIYLHGHYNGGENGSSEEPGVDYRMATAFTKNLHILERENLNHILIHMNTVGGEWSQGMAIYNAISSSQAKITVLASAAARSMSSIILQAADCRVLMPDADFMIHYGSMEISDHQKAVETTIDFSKRSNKRMLEIYSNRCSNGPYFKKKRMNKPAIIAFLANKMCRFGDWWLDAEEALDYGFCDGIFGQSGYENMEMIRQI